MIDLKPYGAFLEHTVRPLIEEFRWFLTELEKHGLAITEANLARILRQVGKWHLIMTGMKAIQGIVIAVIVCWTVAQVLK